MSLSSAHPAQSSPLEAPPSPASAAPAPSAPRPRARALEGGLDSLSEAELLALLLGTGAVGQPVELLAQKLLLEEGGLEGLRRASPRRLAERAGLGLAKALRLLAALELGQRALAEQCRPRLALSRGELVASFASPRLAHLLHEELWVLSLDGQNRLRAFRRVAQGGLHGCAVAARDLLRLALHDGASSIVLVHNHPSGDPRPSAEDLAMTAAVALAGEMVGVPLVDHVIVSPGGKYASLLERGELPPSALGGR